MSHLVNTASIKNPYIGSKGRPLLKNSVVVYIDILGYGETIREVHKAGKDKKFLALFRQTLNDLQEILLCDQVEKETGMHRFEIRTFTDNVVIGIPVTNSVSQHLHECFWKVAHIQLELVLSGFFVRGAIAVGPVFIDNDIVFGKGLLEAYQVERNLARDPRIVLTAVARDRVLANARQEFRKYGHPRMSTLSQFLLRDADGQVYLNYLKTLNSDVHEDRDFKEMFQHRDMVESRLKESIGKPSIWSKYAWVANYHNYFCDQHARILGDIFKVNLGELQMQPAKLF